MNVWAGWRHLERLARLQAQSSQNGTIERCGLVQCRRYWRSYRRLDNCWRDLAKHKKNNRFFS